MISAILLHGRKTGGAESLGGVVPPAAGGRTCNPRRGFRRLSGGEFNETTLTRVLGRKRSGEQESAWSDVAALRVPGEGNSRVSARSFEPDILYACSDGSPPLPRKRYGQASVFAVKFRESPSSQPYTQPMQRHCQYRVKPLILLTDSDSARVVLEARRCNVRVTEIRRRATSRRPSLHKTSSAAGRSEPSSTSSRTNLKGGLSARNAGRNEPGERVSAREAPRCRKMQKQAARRLRFAAQSVVTRNTRRSLVIVCQLPLGQKRRRSGDIVYDSDTIPSCVVPGLAPLLLRDQDLLGPASVR